jgi:hypothetical protein
MNKSPSLLLAVPVQVGHEAMERHLIGGPLKSLITLWSRVLLDAERACCTSAALDLAKAKKRVANEGESFLTITLPDFCRDFEQALDIGQVASYHFAGFRRRGGLPLFLGGFLSLVFDSESGVLLDEPSVQGIQSIRQVLLLCGKIGRPCTDARQKRAIAGYIECEQQLEDNWNSPVLLQELGALCAQVFGPVLSPIERSIDEGALVPTHGPGTTADRITGNRKYDTREWTRRLDEYFPMADFVTASYGAWRDLQSFKLLEPDEELPVRVIPVPKTMKTTRIIAAEPTVMQYAQQSLLREFSRALSSDTGMFTGLEDQIPNQEMARRGSLDGSLATLDLSEASDRVSMELVRAVFSRFPVLLGALEACRSRRASLPSGEILDLQKFASMGSAVCFPVETIVFVTICLNAIRRSLNTPRLSQRTLARLRGTVRVYGDDIIVPTEHVQSVLRELTMLNMVVNTRKSFWTGSFRESCGKEYWRGEDVSVFKVRADLPSTRRDAHELASTVSLRNQAYWSGYWETAWYLDGVLREIVPLPIVEPNSSVLGIHSVCRKTSIQSLRWDRELQKPLVRGLLLRSKSPRSRISGHGALLKCLLPGRAEPFQDKEHLEYYGRPKSANTKIGWGPLL